MRYLYRVAIVMKIAPNLGSVQSVGASKTYPNIERGNRAGTAHGVNYDSISVSSSNKENRFMDLVSRLSQEVRTATTTSDIRALHEEVAADRYLPDPARIAASMLFLREDV